MPNVMSGLHGLSDGSDARVKIVMVARNLHSNYEFYKIFFATVSNSYLWSEICIMCFWAVEINTQDFWVDFGHCPISATGL